MLLIKENKFLYLFIFLSFNFKKKWVYFLNKKLFSCYLNNWILRMINNLIYYLKNKYGLIWSYILKVMNFLIFKDFSRNFLNFLGI